MAAPVSTRLKNTTRAATNGWRPPACLHGAAAWAWQCWTSWTSHPLLRPPSQCLPLVFDTRSPFGWLQPLLLHPRLALGRGATAPFELWRWEKRVERGQVYPWRRGKQTRTGWMWWGPCLVTVYFSVSAVLGKRLARHSNTSFTNVTYSRQNDSHPLNCSKEILKKCFKVKLNGKRYFRSLYPRKI